MASLAKKLSLLFLLTLLSSLQIQARDPQFFNKIPSNNGAKQTEVVEPNNEETLNNKQEQVQEPNFIPENENGGYGLYGHDANQLPPSTTTTTYSTGEPKHYPKYLPKNYNTVAYVTEPEGYKPENNNYNNNNNFYNAENTYYNNNEQQGSLGETKLLGSSNTNPSKNGNSYYTNNNNNNNYGASNNFYHGEQQGMSDTRFNNYNNYNGGNTNFGGVQKQGMSDTRFLENGKYFYDTSMEQKFNRGQYGANNRGYYGNNNNENSFEYNNQDQEEQFQNFQDEEDLP